jgi:hypothetical protein
MDSGGEDSVDSEMEVEVNEESCKRKFSVKITRALEEIWRDEVGRRRKFGIGEEVKGVLDYSKNI